MLNFGGDTTTLTFNLAGNSWPLTEPVKAYLEWVAIDLNDLRDRQSHSSLYWNEDALYLVSDQEEDREVFALDDVLNTVFEEVEDETIWGWIIGCNLTKWHPKDIDPDIETLVATRNRITERVVWGLTSNQNVDDELRDFARDVLGQYSTDDWEAWVSDDPDLRIVEEELGV